MNAIYMKMQRSPLLWTNKPNCNISTNAVRRLKINKLMQTNIQPETWCVQMLNRYASELDQLLWLDYPQGNHMIIQRIKILGTKWHITLQEFWSLLQNHAFIHNNNAYLTVQWVRSTKDLYNGIHVTSVRLADPRL